MNQLIGPAKEFLIAILKKDGVLGVLLVVLVVQNYFGSREARQDARDDRQEASMALRAVSDSLVSIGRRSVEIGAVSSEVIRANTSVIDNTRAILRRVENRLGRSPSGRREDG